MDQEQLQRAIEAILFAAGESVETSRLAFALETALEERERKDALEQMRKAVSVLEPRNEIGRNVFIKQPEPLRKDKTYRYKHTPEDL